MKEDTKRKTHVKEGEGRLERYPEGRAELVARLRVCVCVCVDVDVGVPNCS